MWNYVGDTSSGEFIVKCIYIYIGIAAFIVRTYVTVKDVIAPGKYHRFIVARNIGLTSRVNVTVQWFYP